MIDWDALLPDCTPEEMDAFEADLADYVDWLLLSREAEQSLTGQEP